MEFIGLSPAGLNGIPAEDPSQGRGGHRTGELVMDLVRRDVRPSSIVTRAALENGIASVAATGGSTNGVLHLLAIAHEFGIAARHRRVRGDRRPDADRRRHAAGRAVHRDRTCTRPAASRSSCASCSRGGLLHGDAPTVDGRTIAEIAAAAVETPGQEVVVPIDRRRSSRPAAWRSSAARWRPDGCVVKLAGHERREHRGPARVFDSEARLLRGRPRPADQARRRRRDPLRGPGRRSRDAGDARSVTGALVGEGLGDSVALHHRRPVLRRDPRADDRPHRAGGRARRPDRARRGGRRRS